MIKRLRRLWLIWYTTWIHERWCRKPFVYHPDTYSRHLMLEADQAMWAARPIRKFVPFEEAMGITEFQRGAPGGPMTATEQGMKAGDKRTFTFTLR